MPREKTQVMSKWEGKVETIIIKVDRLQITLSSPFFVMHMHSSCSCILYLLKSSWFSLLQPLGKVVKRRWQLVHFPVYSEKPVSYFKCLWLSFQYGGMKMCCLHVLCIIAGYSKSF